MNPEVEAEFIAAKSVEVMTIEQQCIIAKRVDVVADLRNGYESWFGKWPEIAEVKLMLDVVNEMYAEIAERMKALEFEQFIMRDANDFVNPLNELIPDFDPEWSEWEFFLADLKYHCIAPYGMRIQRLYMAVQDDIQKHEQEELIKKMNAISEAEQQE